jgi:hypothetical protein
MLLLELAWVVAVVRIFKFLNSFFINNWFYFSGWYGWNGLLKSQLMY